MSTTTIEWTQQTWNPVRGCSPVSPGCKNCYAERQGGRFAGPGRPFDGFIQIGKNGEPGPHWTGKVDLIPHMLEVPLKRKIPTTYFVNSMSDLFHENLPPSDRWKVFDAMRNAPWHTYQILTKRAKIMRHFMQDWARIIGAPPANWWLGVSVEDQQRADERIPELLKTPAAVRFLSVEPLLGPVGLKFPDGAGGPRSFPFDFDSWTGHRREEWFQMQARATYMTRCETIDWVIVGGESGPDARPCGIAWIRSIVAQCKAAGVPCFVKQLGARPEVNWDNEPEWPTHVEQVADENGYLDHAITLNDRKGGDMAEWPHDLRVREMPHRPPSEVTP